MVKLNNMFKKNNKIRVGKIPWNRGKHHSIETIKKISQKLKGRKVWNKNKKGLQIAWNKGKKRWWKSPMEFKKGHIPTKGMKGKYHSDETIRKMSKTAKRNGIRPPYYKGENHPSWRGGLTLLKNLIRKCFQYRQWRSDIFTRDDFTCQICGVRGGRIIADHIKAFNLILAENNIKTFEEALACEELWNINNGRVLCQDCHEKTENYGGKNNKKVCHR